MAVNNLVRRLQNVMRNDAGISGDAQRIEQMTWMFFLKVYDAQEDEWEFKKGGNFTSIIPEDLRWRNWAVDNKDGKAKTGDELLAFVNGRLFPSLQNLPLTPQSPKSHWIVKAVFEDINQYMKNGVLLRQVVNIIDEIDFTDAEDRHTFGDIYEGILKDLQSAGNAGEFYTPRALTDFIIQTLNPRLGESVADFTSGTGGFLTSALNYLSEQRQTPQDEVLWQNSVHGQEWKPLPYLLSITNLLVHGVDEPDIIHCDSLGTPVSSFKEKDKMDVIAMNPPYGGSTDAAAKSNFPADMRSSETADLFMVLIMRRLKENGRAGVIIPDGFLFGTDGAKLNIKTTLLQEFNVHTIIRLPGSIFSPYTGINTNIIFFDNNTAEGAPEGYKTKETWFYRLDMPEGYKHFSKTKPMRLVHCQPIADWWINRQEMVTYDDEGNVIEEKSRCYTVQELIDMSCNFDQCKFPKVVDEALRPSDLLREYRIVKDKLNIEVDNILDGVEKLIRDESCREIVKSFETFRDLALLHQSFPSKLKQSFLQEAVSGRLVPQDPSEEPVEEFLNKLVAQRKVILDKKYTPFEPIIDEDIPFEIPSTWRWIKFGDLCQQKMGKTPERKNASFWANGKYPWVSISDMQEYGMIKNTKEFVNQKSYDEVFKGRISSVGSLLMSFKLTVGRTSILDIDAFHNEAIITVIPFYDLNYILRDYLFYILPIMANLGDSKDAIKGRTLNSTSLFNILIPLPPLAEQKRIVAKLEEILPQIDKLG